ncbi:MAG TPA: pyruvate kinase, partial [Clostridia bacterium]|nr:pyruvate kinase [Clostridia bacterium]
MRRTKIICTIGPACDNAEVLGKMLPDMDIARLNFSHGNHEVHLQYIMELRKAAKMTGKSPAILLDIKGPEIRLGILENEPVKLTVGETVILAGNGSNNQARGNSDKESFLRLPVSFKNMAKAVHIGDKILIADGLVSLTVKNIRDYDIYCTVVDGGELYSGKGINVPGVDTGVASLTEKDERDILFGIEQGVDY